MIKMSQVIKRNKEKGFNFFSKDTMEFWGSKVESNVIKNKYFITSEDNFNKTKRHYKIREFNLETGSVWSPYLKGIENKFDTLEEAMQFVYEDIDDYVIKMDD